MFYQSVVASTLFYAVVCCGGKLKSRDTTQLNKVVRKAGSVLGFKFDSLELGLEKKDLKQKVVLHVEHQSLTLWSFCQAEVHVQ